MSKSVTEVTNATRDWSFTLNNYTKEECTTLKRWANEVNLIVVTKEKGQSGTKHLQGRIIFKRTYRLSQLKKLIDRAHWEPTKCKQDSLYILKSDSKPFIDIDNRKQGKRTDLESVIKDISNGATKKKLWIDHTSAMIRYHKGFYEAMKHIAPKETHIVNYSIEDFKPWAKICNWEKMIILIGESGIGKTEFAKAHFNNPLIVSHMDDLAELNEDHDGIIFDDMDFKHIPRTAQIHLCDIAMTRSIHIRYNTAKIPRFTKRIITCNEIPLDIYDPAISRRCNLIKLQPR